MNQPRILQDAPDFSLVLGGPLYQLYVRSHIARPGLELVGRRIVIITLFAWLPLLLLSVLGGSLLGGVKVPFLQDIEAHVRFLIALPVLIAAELIVNQRIRLVVRQFVAAGIVVPEDMPKFCAAIDSTMRLRNSVALEGALIIAVYTLGLWLWRAQIALEAPTWYGGPGGLTLAGYWYAYVSIPLFQFILLRWYMRLVLWFSFLWKVSRLNLRLTPTHPDRAGGLGFLGNSAFAFAPILFAQGALLAGLIASRIFYGGQNLLDFKVEAASLVAFFVVCILGPLTMFSPRLAAAKRQGLREYGAFAARYVQGFDEKWIRRGANVNEQPLGSSDIQSLADLGNSFEVVRQMRAVPFGLDAVTRLAAATAAPLAPLALTIMPFEVLLQRLIKILI